MISSIGKHRVVTLSPYKCYSEEFEDHADFIIALMDYLTPHDLSPIIYEAIIDSDEPRLTVLSAFQSHLVSEASILVSHDDILLVRGSLVEMP
jgi:hypothetical protein